MGERRINPIHNSFKQYKKVNIVNPYMFGIALDPDALAFINATGISNGVQKLAINELVLDFKAAGIWTKMYAIYPFIGGTAFTHKFNLKDPRDLDAAYRITYAGTQTHSSGGVTHVTASTLDTKLVPSVATTINNFHYSLYLNTSINVAMLYCQALMQFFNASGGSIISDMYDTAGGNGRVTATNTAPLNGHFIASRTLPTLHAIYENGSFRNSKNATAGSLPTQSIKIGNNSGSNTTFSFVTMGVGLTTPECSAMYTAIQKYQTSLGRQV